MGLLAWCKLRILERRLYHGAFGKFNRYRCFCLKRHAQTTAEKLSIAREVLSGPGVNTMEAQYNELYIRRHEDQQPSVSPARVAEAAAPQTQPEAREQA